MKVDNLINTREELHKAVQFVSYVPRNHLPKDPSDSTASLIWDKTDKILICQEVDGVVVGLDVEHFQLIIKNHSATKTIAISGREFDDVLIDLDEVISDKGLPAGQLNTDLPYDLPASVQVRGEPFGNPDGDALKLFCNLYHLTDQVLEVLFSTTDGASEVRCWPHHFDMATLLTIEPNDDPEKAKSIGFGFSPGDEGYNEPYFYLTPWPYPDVSSLPAFDKPSFWHTIGWTGAVLKFADIKSSEKEKEILSFFNFGLTELKSVV